MQLRIKTLLLVFFCTCISCASAQFLPTDKSVKYPPTDSIKIYTEEPEQPYKIIGRVFAQGRRPDVNEKQVFEKLKSEAMAVGAHAIIMMGAGEAGSVAAYEVYGSAARGRQYIDIMYKAIAIRFIEQE